MCIFLLSSALQRIRDLIQLIPWVTPQGRVTSFLCLKSQGQKAWSVTVGFSLASRAHRIGEATRIQARHTEKGLKGITLHPRASNLNFRELSRNTNRNIWTMTSSRLLNFERTSGNYLSVSNSYVLSSPGIAWVL